MTPYTHLHVFVAQDWDMYGFVRTRSADRPATAMTDDRQDILRFAADLIIEDGLTVVCHTWRDGTMAHLLEFQEDVASRVGFMQAAKRFEVA